MTALLNKEFLLSIGIQLDEETYQHLSDHYEQTLNKRVIAEIVNYLDDDQVAELGVVADGDDNTVREWLTANVAKLDEIVNDEIAILLGEIAEHADEL